MNTLRTYLAAACLLSMTAHAQQTLFINEIVADNVNGEMDDFFEQDDWIEIYNNGSLVNLGGYYLSDDPLDLTKWQIPTNDPTVTFVTPGSHIIFWCDRDPEQGADHVDFSLNVDGETVLLVAPDGSTVIDSISYPQIATDISYGRSCDGCDEWQFFNHVTFDEPNSEIVPAPQILFINEVQTDNVSTIHDLQWDYDPWIEIFNPNPFQVNLAGYYLGYAGNPLQWQFPSGDPYMTVVPPGGFALIWCDNEPQEGSLHSTLPLAAGPATLFLTAPDGTTTTDSYSYPAIAPNASYGRQSDGSPSSVTFSQPTPRVTNTLIFIEPPLLYINEVLASNLNDATDNMGENEDWFEVYNPNPFEVDLSGYYFSDNPANPMKWMVPNSFPDSVTVPAGSWILFWADEDQTQGVLHSSFRLSNLGEYLGLFSPDGFSIADEVAWSMTPTDVSYGRQTDGNAQWVQFTTTTPDASNNSGTVGMDRTEIAGIRMYPNPTSGRVWFSSAWSGEILSADGRVIAQISGARYLDTSGWPGGCYILRSRGGKVARLVVE